MQSNAKHGRKQVDDIGPFVIDYGPRAITNQNFSKIVALSKRALANCGMSSAKRVNVALVQEGNERYLVLTRMKKEGEEI